MSDEKTTRVPMDQPRHGSLADMLGSVDKPKDTTSVISEIRSASSGHPQFGSGRKSDGSFTLSANKPKDVQKQHQQQPKEEKQFTRGHMFLHKKRGTKVTIIQANVGTSDSGEPLHLVVESKSGVQIKAMEKNLE